MSWRPPLPWDRRWVRRMIMPAIVLAAVTGSYWRSLGGRFIWNDSDYVTRADLRGLDGLGRIWTESGATEQYYPLLHSAFWVEYRLFGDEPLGYHVVTVLLHATACCLLALALIRLAGVAPVAADAVPNSRSAPSRGRGAGARSGKIISASPRAAADPRAAAWLAALLFAVHPVHVESVAWITEQKNTLSLVLYLGAALAYLRFDRTRRRGGYALAVALFVLSLLCKTVTATLPGALGVVLWWRKGRLSWRGEVRPLLPLLVVGAGAGLFSSWVEQHYVGAHGADFAVSATERVLIAGRAVWFYLWHVVCPAGLNFIYPRWTIDPGQGWGWLVVAGVAAMGMALWARRWRGALAAYLFFLGSLLPVLGFVNLYGGLYSHVWDHWQYLADLGPLALIAAGLTRLEPALGKRSWRIGAGALVGLLGLLSWRYSAMFADNVTLFRETLARNPDCWMAHNNLGLELAKSPSRLPEALAHFEMSLRINPENAEAHNNLGMVLAGLPGRAPEAIAHYEVALRLRPDNAEAHNNLAIVLAGLPGRASEALAHFEEALRIRPGFAEAHLNLANILSGIPGREAESLANYEAALRLRADYAEAHYNLANMLANVPGREAEAESHYEAALRIKPDYVEALNNLGILCARQGRLADASRHWERALDLAPDFADARRNLDLLQSGN